MAEARHPKGLQVFPKAAPGNGPESRQGQEIRDGSGPVRNRQPPPQEAPEGNERPGNRPAWTDGDFGDAVIEPGLVVVDIARDGPGEDAHHPAQVEDVAHGLFENVLGGFAELDDAVRELEETAWVDLSPERREWWIDLVRDAIWCGRPGRSDGSYTHVALLRGRAAAVHG